MTSTILPVFLYSLIMTATPGPNNMMLTASGARFGYRRTLPLLIGIVLGICSQLILSALGLGLLFERAPLLQTLLKIVGSAYLFYLAWTVALGGRAAEPDSGANRPPGLLHGFLFQYMNPKAYLMTITAMSVYTLPGENYIKSVLLIISVFIIVAPTAISLWAGFGTILGRLMTGSRHSRPINYGLGILTVASVVFIWL